MLDLNGGQLLLLLSPMSFKGIIIFIDGVYNCGMCNVQCYGS